MGGQCLCDRTDVQFPLLATRGTPIGGIISAAHQRRRGELMAAFPTINVCEDTSQLAGLDLAEIDTGNRAFVWLVVKFGLVAVALVSAGLGLSPLG